MVRTLSVFCDESGDFGEVEPHAPYYLLTLVMHDQTNSIENQVNRLEESLSQGGPESADAIHTAPLVRRERPYEHLQLKDRRRYLSHIEHFARSCPIQTKTIVIDKRIYGGGDGLAERIARELGMFIRDNLPYFQSFDEVIVYYDRGQRQISAALKLIFSSTMSSVEFRTVSPKDYRLFQVADLACTLELYEQKLKNKELGSSELRFFDGERNLKKNHLKLLKKLRF